MQLTAVFHRNQRVVEINTLLKRIVICIFELIMLAAKQLRSRVITIIIVWNSKYRKHEGGGYLCFSLVLRLVSSLAIPVFKLLFYEN